MMSTAREVYYSSASADDGYVSLNVIGGELILSVAGRVSPYGDFVEVTVSETLIAQMAANLKEWMS